MTIIQILLVAIGVWFVISIVDFLARFIWNSISFPVNKTKEHLLEIGKCHSYISKISLNKEFFDKVSELLLEGRHILKDIGDDLPNKDQITKINKWKSGVNPVLKNKNDYYYNLFNNLDDLNDVEYFMVGNQINNSRKINPLDKEYKEKRDIQNNKDIIELTRCLTVLSFVKIMIHSVVFPSQQQ